MAIFRGGVKIFGSDVRLGLRRDRSLDNILLDPRFRDIEGGQQPDNPNLISTKSFDKSNVIIHYARRRTSKNR